MCVGIVTSSHGREVEVITTSPDVGIGSIVKIGKCFGIVTAMYYSEDEKIGSKQPLISKIEIFGTLHEKGVKPIKRPIPPYQKVYLATPQELEHMLKKRDKNISIGKVYGTDAKAYLNPYEYDRHLAILAATGAGKSYTAANLIAQFANLSMPVVVVDTHGEYSELLSCLLENNPSINFSIETYTLRYGRSGLREFKIPISNLEAEDFQHFTYLTEAQFSALCKVLELLDEEYTLKGKNYGIEDIIAKVEGLITSKETQEFHEGTLYALLRKLRQLKRVFHGVFDVYGSEVSNIVKPGQVTIIDTSLAPQGVRRSVVAYLCKELLQGRINEVNKFEGKRIPYPLLLVIEEAHNYASQNLAHSCRRQLSRVASEGRKFGVGLCVISQKPSKIDEEILSQCNTGIYMHITNPNDKNHIKRSFECISDAIISDLDSLDVGECIMAGAMVNIPFLLCEVDTIPLTKTKKFEFEIPEVKKIGGEDYI